ncbi:hypothetical protein FA09DRAFT_258411 [Tilletiopsis washingtonensis]|uniref:Uncharacterized protein n=1 Tax=Tilletiopsis washingtonensis TaxID=58919 RepID=A0A316ZAP7_9BASI|nr:hypothetical protein FA09DRAFT_258411 [Tilletiopsis washingtonensis]PWN98897.1 hypothetical protein FA09DRAFT_258411 [Tilletiopsis washingtonensis]
MIAMLATFGIRAYISNNAPTTTLMIAMNAMLAIMPPLLLEPLLNLLGLYAKQGQAGSGVPTVTSVLRVFNLLALILYAVAAAYTGVYLSDWERTLLDPNAVGALSSFPDTVPKQVVRLGPIIGSFFMLVAIAGGLLLIPVARGANGSMRPGGFLAVLLILIGIATSYRILQSLHAQARLEEETTGSTRNPFADIFGLGTSSSASYDNARPQPNTFQSMMDDVYRAARGFQVAPVGMYEPASRGIAWAMLQQALAGRGAPQTPIVFNLVYILPMWLQTLLLFFVHAPGAKKPPPGEGDA